MIQSNSYNPPLCQSGKDGSLLSGIQISAMTSMIDLDFTMQQIFNKVSTTVDVCMWPSEKLHEEILRAIKTLQTTDRRKRVKVSYNEPFFIHCLVELEDCSVRFYVNFDGGSFDQLKEIPAYSFCYR